MVFRMRAYIYIYTHGDGHTDTARQSTYLTRKNSEVFLVLQTVLESSTFGSPVQRSNHCANPSPHCYYYYCTFEERAQHLPDEEDVAGLPLALPVGVEHVAGVVGEDGPSVRALDACNTQSDISLARHNAQLPELVMP